MLLAAAEGLADYVSKERLKAGNIYPDLGASPSALSMRVWHIMLAPNELCTAGQGQLCLMLHVAAGDLRDISAAVAAAVAEAAFKQGVAGIDKPQGRVVDYIKSRMWSP